MEAVVVDPKWVETFKSISKDEINSPNKVCKHELRARPNISKLYKATNDDEYDLYGISEEDLLKRHNEDNKIISEQREKRMERMRSLFISQPKLETICKDWSNDFVDSGFTTYKFCNFTYQQFDTQLPDDLEYIINLCGYNLTKIYVNGYCPIMPLIKSNCPNLEELLLTFDKMESKDFEDAFSNMPHLKKLMFLLWECKDPILPMTLVKSIEQVRETLTELAFSYCITHKFYPIGLPDSSVEMYFQVYEALMTTVGNMKNLEHLTIRLPYDVTDEFLINLVDNAKKLKYLWISGSRITDKGIIALNKLNQLEFFDLDGVQSRKENKFITDESIKDLFSETITYFNISKCIQVTNSSVIELSKHLPNLKSMNVTNTQVNLEGILEIAKLRKGSDNFLQINTSFKTNDDLDESLFNESKISCLYIPDSDYDSDEN
ncbi:uncharacterized protein LOC122855627 [Aphidius gifuensis]|uniref:uncharacterized protein LOC122855627 n=1 Tax=Aphidius gifuensis TaxID=684658 RepID=UPI001CDC3D2F|nr:uncharacterized protein LOC122855627 [Aphidius gifuensis]